MENNKINTFTQKKNLLKQFPLGITHDGVVHIYVWLVYV